MNQEFRPRIAVVGSFMMDLVVQCNRLPLEGQTIVGQDFNTFVGGKGSNQAIAAARLGANVSMIGRVGTDNFGDELLKNLSAEGVDSQFVVKDTEMGTGVAMITVDANGDNTIVAVPKANMSLNPDNIDQAESAIAVADILLLQLEVSLLAVQRAAEIAKANGVPVLLNPAPARRIPMELMSLVDILVPNETETEFLTGFRLTDMESIKSAAKHLLEESVPTVVLTLGDQGALLATAEDIQLVPSYSVKAVDATAAGDAFCGTLAVSVARGDSWESAVNFANAAGALAVTKLGAAPSIPTREQVIELIERNRN
ncbi:MAG: ribokinase [Candidatus Poribacteria bacterium]|nr:ribokinase [Candidatus Poribacteria bacterium]